MDRLWRAVCGLLVAAALVAPPAVAQGPGKFEVYLPIVYSGEVSEMPARLVITDGTITIDFLSPLFGYRLIDWSQDIPDLKAGGVWQDSPLADERQPAYGVFGNSTDRMTLLARDVSADALISDVNLLWSLLDKGRRYWIDAHTDEMVWIEARAPNETNTRYTIVKTGRIPDLPNPYTVPFQNTATQTPAIEKLSVLIEHGPWLANLPGVDACVEASGTQAGWVYTGWEAVDANQTFSFVQSSSTGRIFAGQVGTVQQSDDDGLTWAVSTAAPAASIRSMIQTSTGRILAGENGNMWKTDNNGVLWAAVAAPQPSEAYKMIQLPSGRLLLATDGDIYRSDDDGENWVALASSVTGNNYAITQTPTGRVIVGNQQQEIWYSDDEGASWTLVWTGDDTGATIYSLLTLADGRILAGASAYSRIYASADNGLTWSLINPSYPTVNNVMTMLQMTITNPGRVYAGVTATDGILVSNDTYSWSPFFTTPTETDALLETAAGTLLAGDGWPAVGAIYRLGTGATADMGQAETCSDQVFIANKKNVANLTNMYTDDGGAWTGNLFPIAGFPQDLLPAAPAVGDALYVGVDTSVPDTGPFESLVWDLLNIITYTNSYTITPEYYTGAAWATLTMQDGTNPGTGMFRVPGVSSMHWTPPSNWATRALNLDGGPAVTGYWVRFRVSALVGAMTPPSQQNRDIYTIVLPYAEIDAGQVPGTLPMYTRLRVNNRSDRDGRGGNAPNLYDNRVIIGLRSYDRGPTFTAYLNAADEQNPIGVAVSLGVNTAFGNDVQAITGRVATYTGDGLATWSDEVTFTLGPTIARDYYGTFHAFLRATLDGGGGLSDIHARLQVRTGSGGVTFTSDEDWLKGTTGFEVLDLGQVSIPASGDLNLSDLGDSTLLVIQMRDDSGGGLDNLIHDLILIPVDEWAADSWDEANATLSVIGRQSGTPHMLDLDSVRMPKRPNRATVRTADGNEFVTAIYTPGMVSPAMLQANADQRLWFFAMRTSATGSSYIWLAEPWIAHSLRITGVARYVTMRGDE